MSFSWTYLTRRFWMQNYRDYAAVGIVTSYVMGHVFSGIAAGHDDIWVRQRVYTHDESDITYREVTNRTDGAVKREHAMRYAEKIKGMRAERERAASLDAYNFLNNKSLELWNKLKWLKICG